jgi:pyruvate-formate lyase
MAMNFKEGRWNHEINVTDFVKTNITPYEGDASFLVGPTERTKAVWNKCLEALAEERANNGVRLLLDHFDRQNEEKAKQEQEEKAEQEDAVSEDAQQKGVSESNG